MHHLFVISDLHFGGKPPSADVSGFQICPPDSRRRLARLIHKITRQELGTHSADSIELVINGDWIDFLTEEPFRDFCDSEAEALTKFDTIIKSTDADAPVGEQFFPAIQQFLSLGHKLTILLGNHDLELSLPHVRRSFLRLLTHDKPARIEFLLDGEAHVYGDVLIEHGNRYDGWNVVSMGALRALRSATSRNEPRCKFSAPAGSKLVAEVMNPIKSRYRFIDLLKPENETLIPILCALEPELLWHLKKLVPLWLMKRAAEGEPGRVKKEETYIATTDERSHNQVEMSPLPPRVDDFGSIVPKDASETLQRCQLMLDESAKLIQGLSDGMQNVRVPKDQMTISSGATAWLSSSLSLWRMGQADSRGRYLLLARAFEAHRKAIETTFELSSKDPPYHTAAERLASQGGFKVIIFGHTHIPKALQLKDGAVYLNTGSWCRTIRLSPKFYSPDKLVGAEEELHDFVEDLAQNRLERWVELRTLFAHVEVQGEVATRVALCEVDDAGDAVPIFEHSWT